MAKVAAAVLAVALQVAGSPAAAEQLTLRDRTLVQTAMGRQLLQYLVNCALPPETTLAFEVDSTAYVLPGGLGLAPAWAERPLTEQEERRVSGCILARTNFFGVPVQLSMRSEAADAREVLKAGEQERQAFPFFEAAFFGNIFQPERETYVCTGDNSPRRQVHLQSLLRVCSLPASDAAGATSQSRCSFVITGACKDESFQRQGIDYTADAIRVYLPAAPVRANAPR